MPVFCVQEPQIPLLLSKAANLFKLFLADVGLLASMYADGLQLKVLSRETDINFGSIYENAVAQELKAHGFDLYYFNSKNRAYPEKIRIKKRRAAYYGVVFESRKQWI